MSNDLSIFSGGELSADAVNMLAELKEKAKADLARLGPVGGKDTISVTQDKKFKMPNDATVETFDCHIVGFVYRNEYYMDTFNRKEYKPPACFAIAESSADLIPSANSPVIQSKTTCSVCQQNQFGSSPVGAGKACKNGVSLAVVPTDDPTNHDIWIVKVSPTAIRAFNSYAAKLAQKSVPLASVVTRIYMDPELSYASLRFDAVTVIPENVEPAMAREDEALLRLKQEPDVSKFKAA